MARAYFQVYFSYEEPLKSLSYEQIGKIFMAMFQYEKTKEKPELDPVSDMAFYFIRSQMDRDRQMYEEKCERSRQNGMKGGRPRKSEKSQGFLENQPVFPETQKTQRFLENQPVFLETQKSQGEGEGEGKGKYNIIGADKPPKKEKPQRNIIPPDLEWVKSYCKERQNNVDPKRFFDHYESIGWKIGKQTMKDWQAAVRTWEPIESQEQKSPLPAPKSIYREL